MVPDCFYSVLKGHAKSCVVYVLTDDTEGLVSAGSVSNFALYAVIMRSDEQKGFHVLPRRWVLERTFAWPNHNRRLCKDYEVLRDL